MQSQDSSKYARWFRDSTPYIGAHRGRTFVVLLPGEALAQSQLTNIVHDLALLNVLGVRLVVVYGCRAQLADAGVDAEVHNGLRVTGQATIRTLVQVIGTLGAQLEALFSTGLPATPMHNSDISVCSGNLVTARPLGVIDGCDYLFTGVVRRVHTERLGKLLDTGSIVLQPPLGYSSSGQAYNLAAADLAAELAKALNAEKLIVFDELPYLADGSNQRIGDLRVSAVSAHTDNLSAESAQHLRALEAAVRGGVPKGHLLSYRQDGALLEELFTAPGVGTQISDDPNFVIRGASESDLSDIVEIIRPLEEAGALVRRSRDRLEAEIEHYIVAEIDGVVVATCALYLHGDAAELACVAVKASFRNLTALSVGRAIVEAAESRAVSAGAQTVFVLTTQAEHWFAERGFQLAGKADLPAPKRALYNDLRAAKVMIKTLETS